MTGALTPVNPAGGGHLWSTSDMENKGGPETSKCVTLALSGRSMGGEEGTHLCFTDVHAQDMSSDHVLALGARGGGRPDKRN